MTDIDLIPSDYREKISASRIVNYGLAAAGTVVIIAGAVILVLLSLQSNAQSTAESLATQYATTEQKQTQLASLNEQLKDLDEQVQTLQGLRGGGLVTQLFSALDNSLDHNDIRILNWDIYRDARFATAQDVGKKHNYSWQLPKRYQRAQTSFWRVNLQMEIRGQVDNYASLSEFVNTMLAQSEFETVEILRTNLREVDDKNFVEFFIIAKINNAEMG